MIRTSALSFGVAGLALAAALVAGPAFAAKVYYVDYVSGSDANNGLAPTAAWKHAPGDSRSTGVSKLLTLAPGDRLLFKGGVRYKSGFSLRATGEPGNPVVVDGSSWGNSRAVIDGGDALTGVRKCASQADCLGSPHWAKLWRADLPTTAVWSDWLFVNDVALMPASYPAMSDSEMQDRDKYLTYSKEQAPLVLGCFLPQALPAGLDKGTPVVALWVQPNNMAFGDNVQVTSTGVNVVNAHWIRGDYAPYCDRTGSFALMNVPAMVSRPGLFAMSPKDGVAIFWPAGLSVARVSTGGHRHGINLGRVSNVEIRGFTFTGYSGSETDGYAGTALLNMMRKDGITIRDNIFKGLVSLAKDTAAIWIMGNSNLKIEFNQFTNIPWSPVMSVGNMPGPGSIRCNRISKVGGTTILALTTNKLNIVGNDIREVYGVHANAISAYQDNRDMTISDNVVIDAHRPITINGGKTEYFTTEPHRVTVTRNTFVSPHGEDGAVISWGLSNGFTLVNNDMSNPRYALKLAGSEIGFSATGNRMVGAISVGNKAPMVAAGTNQMFDPAGNGVLVTQQMRAATVRPEVCTRT